MADVKTEPVEPGPAVQKKGIESPLPPAALAESGVPSSGHRAALRDLRRQLTDDELTSPGVQKLILDMLEEADAEREFLRSYITLYHESDKKAAVLAEKLLTQNTLEIFFGVGVGLGGTIIGLAPFLWGAKSEYGIVTGLIGLAITVGSSLARMVKR